MGKIKALIGGIVMLTLLLSGCEEIDQEGLTIFPKGDETWVGDPMPFYDGNQFRIFYLEDLRDGDIGFHPWSLLSTNNFFEYENERIVIPYSKKPSAQDLALGTGSVVKDENGLFHAFYTGHNPRIVPKEAIMHATSTDLVSWTKIPEDTFYASEQYDENDYRDPYVFYNEKHAEHWMLITTRKNDMGVIALYTSSNLKNWDDHGVLFTNDMGSNSNLECPTLIRFGDYWYLSFSDQWPDRVVHYRIAKDPKGPFIKPSLDYFDGNGFYAGRLEKDEKDLYLFGWTPTKEKYRDSNNYNWAGTLVVHQIKQKENGELYPVPVKQITERINHKVKIAPVRSSESVEISRDKYSFSGSGDEVVIFPEVKQVNKITGKIKLNSENGIFGFVFNVKEDNRGPVNIVFNKKLNQLQFFNVSTNNITSTEPQSRMMLNMEENDSLEFTLLIDKSVAVIYVNDQAVLSTRMFGLQNNQWGIFSIDSDNTFEDVELYK